MQTILTVLHLFLALGLIGLVLIQHGKGADMGAAFGSGASSTVFGARGSGNFLSRATGVLAAVFFVTSMALAYFSAQVVEPEGLMDRAGELPVAPMAIEVNRDSVPDVPPPVAVTEEGSEVPPPADVPLVGTPEVDVPPAVPDAESSGQGAVPAAPPGAPAGQ